MKNLFIWIKVITIGLATTVPVLYVFSEKLVNFDWEPNNCYDTEKLKREQELVHENKLGKNIFPLLNNLNFIHFKPLNKSFNTLKY